jgi:glycogen synthase
LKAFAGVDIVHHVGQATALIGFAAADAAKRLGVPFVVQPTCHPMQLGDTALDLRLYRLADELLTHTKFEANYFNELGIRCPIHVVGNGIEDRNDGNPERFRNQFGIHGEVVLYIGRKDHDKGFPLVIDAFEEVRRKRNDVTLVCIGPDGSAKVDHLDGVVNLGFVPDDVKHDALAACRCLCVPSAGESFGLVFMEAGRYRKPVVARRLPVMEELLDGGRAGLLIGAADPSRNTADVTVNEVSGALLKLLDSPDECRRLGENCHRVSSAFVWPLAAGRFEQAYRSALEQERKTWGISKVALAGN